MRLLDSRRLTGASLHGELPVALAEVATDGLSPEAAEASWRREVTAMLKALGWQSTLSVRHYPGGMDVMLSAPIDVLLAATEVNEWAVASASASFGGMPDGTTPPPLQARATEIAALAETQRNPALLTLQGEAKLHDVPFLWDDEMVSVGLGKRSLTFAVNAIAEVIDWTLVGRIPVALVTGTNGKTTCSRLLARMVQQAGLVCGNSTSDAVTIGGVIVDEGDWTGPAAARMVLRDPRVELAVLETARGGILRRGLALNEVDVALITNVSEDHTGGYGVFDLETMTRVKRVPADAAKVGVVLNADDERLRRLRFAAPVTWFSLHPRADGAFVRDGMFIWSALGKEHALLSVAQAPLCFGGAATYNVANALACIAMGFVLGLPESAIVAALVSFGRVPSDNPGRAERYERDGVSILLDFAHNPDGISGVLALAKSWMRGRLFVIAGGAGDRSDEELRSGARAIADAHPHRVLCRDLHGYLRGRVPGEVPSLLQAELRKSGLAPESVSIEPDESACLRQALSEALPGDVIVLLVHVERQAVRALLS